MPSNPPSPAVALLRAYIEAVYRLVEPPLQLRIGRRADALEQLHPRARRFALITACNPGSEQLGAAENHARLAQLDAALAALGAISLAGLNSAPDGGWKEPSRLVLDLDPSVLDALACRFGQNATLAWRRGQAVRLRLYRTDWRAQLADARMDTRFVDWVACAPP